LGSPPPRPAQLEGTRSARAWEWHERARGSPRFPQLARVLAEWCIPGIHRKFTKTIRRAESELFNFSGSPEGWDGLPLLQDHAEERFHRKKEPKKPFTLPKNPLLFGSAGGSTTTAGSGSCARVVKGNLAASEVGAGGIFVLLCRALATSAPLNTSEV